MKWLTIFGVIALTGTGIFYALEDYGRRAALAFAAACALASLYGLLQGVWPLGLLEGVWSAVALHPLVGSCQLADLTEASRRGNDGGRRENLIEGRSTSCFLCGSPMTCSGRGT